MKQSFKIALGGLTAALSLACMFFSGIFPFAEYSLPALAGILLVVLVLELGFKTAMLTYAVVAVLSLMITPNKEAAILFAVFFGYYPIVKGKIEQIRRVPLQWVIKLALFNTVIVAAYFVIEVVFGFHVLIESQSWLKFGYIPLLLIANAVFLLYDRALTNLISYFIRYIRPKYQSKLK